MPRITPKIPQGLEELMLNLAKSVIKENPQNLYEFAAEYFEKLLKERDGKVDDSYKKLPAYKAYKRAKLEKNRLEIEGIKVELESRRRIASAQTSRSFSRSSSATKNVEKLPKIASSSAETESVPVEAESSKKSAKKLSNISGTAVKAAVGTAAVGVTVGAVKPALMAVKPQRKSEEIVEFNSDLEIGSNVEGIVSQSGSDDYVGTEGLSQDAEVDLRAFGDDQVETEINNEKIEDFEVTPASSHPDATESVPIYENSDDLPENSTKNTQSSEEDPIAEPQAAQECRENSHNLNFEQPNSPDSPNPQEPPQLYQPLDTNPPDDIIECSTVDINFLNREPTLIDDIVTENSNEIMENGIDSNERKADGNDGDKINEIAGNKINYDENISMTDKVNGTKVEESIDDDVKNYENSNQKVEDEKLVKNSSINSASSAENDYHSSNPSIKSSEFSNLSGESVKYEVLNVSSDTQESQSFDDNFAGNVEVLDENLQEIKLVDQNLSKSEPKVQEPSEFGSELLNKIRYFEENSEVLEDSEEIVEDMETKFEKFGEIMRKIEESDERTEKDYVKLSKEVDNESANSENIDKNQVTNAENVEIEAEKNQEVAEDSAIISTVPDKIDDKPQPPEDNADNHEYDLDDFNPEDPNEDSASPVKKFLKIHQSIEKDSKIFEQEVVNIENILDTSEKINDNFTDLEPIKEVESEDVDTSILNPEGKVEPQDTNLLGLSSDDTIDDDESTKIIETANSQDNDESEDVNPLNFGANGINDVGRNKKSESTANFEDEELKNPNSDPIQSSKVSSDPTIASKLHKSLLQAPQNPEVPQSPPPKPHEPVPSPDYYHEVDSKATTAEMKDDEFIFKSPRNSDISKIIEQEFTVDDKFTKKSVQGNESEISGRNDIELSQQNVNEAATGSDNINGGEKVDDKIELANQDEDMKVEVDGNEADVDNLIAAQDKDTEKDKAALKIQSMFRGYQVRKSTKIQKFEEKIEEIVNNKFEPKPQEPSEFGSELVSIIRDFKENDEDSEEVVVDMETKFEKFGEIMRKIEESEEKVDIQDDQAEDSVKVSDNKSEIEHNLNKIEEAVEKSDLKSQEYSIINDTKVEDEKSIDEVDVVPGLATVLTSDPQNPEEATTFVDGNATENSKDEDFIDILLDQTALKVSNEATGQKLEPTSTRTKRSISPETGEIIEDPLIIEHEDSWTDDFDVLKIHQKRQTSASEAMQNDNNADNSEIILNPSNLKIENLEDSNKIPPIIPETSSIQDGIDEVDTSFDHQPQDAHSPDNESADNSHPSYFEGRKVKDKDRAESVTTLDSPERIKHDDNVELIEEQTKIVEVNNFEGNEEPKINEIVSKGEESIKTVNKDVGADEENPQSNIDTSAIIDKELNENFGELSKSEHENRLNFDTIKQLNDVKASDEVSMATNKSIDSSKNQKVDETEIKDLKLIDEKLSKQPEDSSSSDSSNDLSGFNYEVLPSPPTDSPGETENDENFDEIVQNLTPNSKENGEIEQSFEKIVENLDENVESWDGNLRILDGNVENLNVKMENSKVKMENSKEKVESSNKKMENLSEKVENLDVKMENSKEKMKNLDEEAENSVKNEKITQNIENSINSPENSDKNLENPNQNPEKSTETPENTTRNAQIFDKYLDIYDENLENFEFFTNNPDGTLKKSHKIVEKLNEIVDDEVAKYVEKIESKFEGIESNDENLDAENEATGKIEGEAQFDVFEYAVPDEEVAEEKPVKSIDLPLVFKIGENIKVETENMENSSPEPEVIEEPIIKEQFKPQHSENIPIPQLLSSPKNLNDQENAAVKIQSFFRGFKVRKSTKPKKRSPKESSIFGNELVDKIQEFEQKTENLENSDEKLEDMETKFQKFGEIMKKIEESEEKVNTQEDQVEDSNSISKAFILQTEDSMKKDKNDTNLHEKEEILSSETSNPVDSQELKTSNPEVTNQHQDNITTDQILNPLQGFSKLSEKFEPKIEENSAEQAAVKIQSLFRGFKVRKSNPPKKYKQNVKEPSAFGSELVDKIEEFEEKVENSDEVVEDMEVKFEKFGEIMKKIEESEEVVDEKSEKILENSGSNIEHAEEFQEKSDENVKNQSILDPKIERNEENFFQKDLKVTESQANDDIVEVKDSPSDKIQKPSTKSSKSEENVSNKDKEPKNHSNLTSKSSENTEQANAAVKIQSFFRGFKVRQSNPTKQKNIEEPSEFGSELVEKIQDFEENKEILESSDENLVDMEEKFEKFGEIMRKIEESDEKFEENSKEFIEKFSNQEEQAQISSEEKLENCDKNPLDSENSTTVKPDSNGIKLPTDSSSTPNSSATKKEQKQATVDETNAAVKIQSFFRGFNVRKSSKSKPQEASAFGSELIDTIQDFQAKNENSDEYIEDMEATFEKFGDIMKKIEESEENVEKIEENEFKETEKFDERLEKFDGKLKNSNKKLENAYEKLEKFDGKWENLGEKLEKFDEKLENSDGKLENSYEKSENSGENLENSYEKLEKFDGKSEKSDEKFENLGEKLERSGEKLENSDDKFENALKSDENSKSQPQNKPRSQLALPQTTEEPPKSPQNQQQNPEADEMSGEYKEVDQLSTIYEQNSVEEEPCIEKIISYCGPNLEQNVNELNEKIICGQEESQAEFGSASENEKLIGKKVKIPNLTKPEVPKEAEAQNFDSKFDLKSQKFVKIGDKFVRVEEGQKIIDDAPKTDDEVLENLAKSTEKLTKFSEKLSKSPAKNSSFDDTSEKFEEISKQFDQISKEYDKLYKKIEEKFEENLVVVQENSVNFGKVEILDDKNDKFEVKSDEKLEEKSENSTKIEQKSNKSVKNQKNPEKIESNAAPDEPQIDEQAKAAVKIQSSFRGYKVRKSRFQNFKDNLSEKFNLKSEQKVDEPSIFGSELVEKIKDFNENEENSSDLGENFEKMEEKFEKFGQIMKKIEESGEKVEGLEGKFNIQEDREVNLKENVTKFDEKSENSENSSSKIDNFVKNDEKFEENSENFMKIYENSTIFEQDLMLDSKNLDTKTSTQENFDDFDMDSLEYEANIQNISTNVNENAPKIEENSQNLTKIGTKAEKSIKSTENFKADDKKFTKSPEKLDTKASQKPSKIPIKEKSQQKLSIKSESLQDLLPSDPKSINKLSHSTDHTPLLSPINSDLNLLRRQSYIDSVLHELEGSHVIEGGLIGYGDQFNDLQAGNTENLHRDVEFEQDIEPWMENEGKAKDLNEVCGKIEENRENSDENQENEVKNRKNSDEKLENFEKNRENSDEKQEIEVKNLENSNEKRENFEENRENSDEKQENKVKNRENSDEKQENVKENRENLDENQEHKVKNLKNSDEKQENVEENRENSDENQENNVKNLDYSNEKQEKFEENRENSDEKQEIEVKNLENSNEKRENFEENRENSDEKQENKVKNRENSDEKQENVKENRENLDENQEHKVKNLKNSDEKQENVEENRENSDENQENNVKNLDYSNEKQEKFEENRENSDEKQEIEVKNLENSNEKRENFEENRENSDEKQENKVKNRENSDEKQENVKENRENLDENQEHKVKNLKNSDEKQENVEENRENSDENQENNVKNLDYSNEKQEKFEENRENSDEKQEIEVKNQENSDEKNDNFQENSEILNENLLNSEGNVEKLIKSDEKFHQSSPNPLNTLKKSSIFPQNPTISSSSHQKIIPVATVQPENIKALTLKSQAKPEPEATQPKQSSIPNHSKQAKNSIMRQKTMPVQFESSVMRVLPKHLRKR
ncbi:hypothetical protein ACKWTF_015505 [Chironomus riparius]